MPQPKSPRTSKAAGAAKKPAAKKPAAAKKSASAAKKEQARSRQEARDEAMRANLTQLRELLSGGVVLTAQRLQDALDEAVRGGHMTRNSAEDLARGLLEAGRKQTQEVIADVEALLDRGRSDLGAASSAVIQRSDRVLREVDKVRRTAGIGPVFPILGYDDLTAAQVGARLDDLKPAELRKVRDYERRNANRKSVLSAIERLLPKA